MPIAKSKQVDPKFQQALQGAVHRFRSAKSLWRHHHNEIDLIEEVVNNSSQSNRELRDETQKACRKINSGWRHRVVSSLLVDYVQAVLLNPQFNVERIYEAAIDDQDICIKSQGVRIAGLEQDNRVLRGNSNLPIKELEEKLSKSEAIIEKALQQQKLSDEKLAQCTQLIQLLGKRLEELEKDYQTLYETHLETIHEKHSTVKPPFKAPPPPQVRADYLKGPFTEKSTAENIDSCPPSSRVM
jgi:hypothetical protein